MLHPNLQTGNFAGEIEISLKLSQKTNVITLHSNELSIDGVEYTEGTNNVNVPATVSDNYNLLWWTDV